MSTTKPWPCNAAVAASRLWPTRLGTCTFSGPLLTWIVTCEPRDAPVPAGGSVPMILPVAIVVVEVVGPYDREPEIGELLRRVVVRPRR